MRAPSWFAGLDIGSTVIAATVARRDLDGRLCLVAQGMAPSAGVVDSQIVDAGALAAALEPLIELMARYGRGQLDRVALAVDGQQLRVVRSAAETHWPRSVAIDPAVVVSLRRDAHRRSIRTGPVLATIDTRYEVDRRQILIPPVGASARQLRIEIQSYVAPARHVVKYERLLAGYGLSVDALAPRAVAAGTAVLRPAERDQGVAVVDIGSGSTDAAAYIDGRLASLLSIPIGHETIVNDVALVLGLPQVVANEVYARLLLTPAQREGRMIGDRQWPVAVARRVAETRVQELMTAIGEGFDQQGLGWRLGSGVVLTGPSAQLPGALKVAARTLRMPVRLGVPVMAAEHHPSPPHPGLAAAIGLVCLQAGIWHTMAAEQSRKRWQPEPVASDGAPARRSGVMPALGRWLREFVPSEEVVYP